MNATANAATTARPAAACSGTLPRPRLVVAPGRRRVAVVGFTVVRGGIAAIDLMADPVKLGRS